MCPIPMLRASLRVVARSRGRAPRRFFAARADPEGVKYELDDPRVARAAAAVVGLVIVTRLIPEKKAKKPELTHPNAENHRLKPTAVEPDTLPPITPKAPAAEPEPAAAPSQPATPEPLLVVTSAPTPLVAAITAPTPVATSAPTPPAPPSKAPPPPAAKVAPAPVAPAPVASAPVAARDACTLLGTSASWRIFLEEGSVYAASLVRRAAAPIRLTPRGVGVGAVMLGDGELLVELDGYSPGYPALHRIALPPADEPAVAWTVPPMPQPDSPPPAGSVGATVRAWITNGKPLAAIGALVRLDDGSQALYMRSQEMARVGSSAWLATCRRLKLPDPPVDPSGPPILSEWRQVRTWDAGSGEQVTLLGFAKDTAWVHEAVAKTASGYTADGKRTELPLF